jgi:hypothetical protein
MAEASNKLPPDLERLIAEGEAHSTRSIFQLRSRVAICLTAAASHRASRSRCDLSARHESPRRRPNISASIVACEVGRVSVASVNLHARAIGAWPAAAQRGNNSRAPQVRLTGTFSPKTDSIFRAQFRFFVHTSSISRK